MSVSGADGAPGVAGAVPGAVLDHAGVVVTDLDAAAEFFRTAFGARELFRLDRVEDPTGDAPARLGAPRQAAFALVMLELGGGRLELVRWWTPSRAEGAAVTAAGSAHVAIRVEDVARILDRLGATVEVVGEPRRFDSGPTPGLTNAFLRTPGGVLVELVSWEAA